MELYLTKFKRRVRFEKTGYGKEDMFLYLTEDLVEKIDKEKYPNSIFLFKNEEAWFEINSEQDEKNGYIWCSNKHYWSIFENEYGLNYAEIQKFTKDMVGKHFKLKELTPSAMFGYIGYKVGKHFKLKELTPKDKFSILCHLVGKHFKLKELTPNVSKSLWFGGVGEHFKLK